MRGQRAAEDKSLTGRSHDTRADRLRVGGIDLYPHSDASRTSVYRCRYRTQGLRQDNVGATVEKTNHLTVSLDWHRGHRPLRGELHEGNAHLLGELASAGLDEPRDEFWV